MDGVHPGQKGTKRRQSNAKDSKNSFFPALIKGTESDRTVEHRYEMFKNLWLPLEEALRVQRLREKHHLTDNLLMRTRA